jgi:L-alanine-DL-glutamate epimerase-like enolase superfamily enzyme
MSKITGFSIERYRVTGHAYRWRQGLRGGAGGPGVAALLRVHSDSGHDGLCWMDKDRISTAIVEEVLAPAFTGADIWLRESLWYRMWELDRIEMFPIYALNYIDAALWDLQSKIAGVPAWRLLGGHKPAAKAYASTVTFDTLDEYLQVIDGCLQRGYKAIKLHAWGIARADAQLALAVRRHVGPDIDLMFDGSAGYNFDDSLRLGRALEEANYLWFEEPLREYNLYIYERLCQTLDIPILGAETPLGCHFNASEWVLRGACDRLRTSWCEKGGFTGALKVAHLAESFQLQTDVHGDDLGALHLVCALPNSEWLEVLVPEGLFGNPTIRGPLFPDADGMVYAPETPGIGWEPRPDLRLP